MHQHKNSFTLLELFLTISLCTLLFTFSGLKIARYLKEERFEKEVELLSCKISFAEELHLTYQKDFFLTFTQSARKNSLVVELSCPDSEVQKQIHKLSPPLFLKEIEQIQKEGAPVARISLFSEDLVPIDFTLTAVSRKTSKLLKNHA